MSSQSHFFDIDTLLSVDNKVWIVDKTNPNIPIMKISKSEFNLIKSGIYRSQSNKIDFNGRLFWLPTNLINKLKIKVKNNKVNFANLAISLQEFSNPDIIDHLEYTIKFKNIENLVNKSDDIYIICSKQVKRNYQKLINKLESELKEKGVSIKHFYFISESFYNQNEDDIKFKKMRLLIQHLIGYKTNGDEFTNEELERYDVVNFYDNNYDTIKVADEINNLLKVILHNTEKNLRDVIKEDINDYTPSLVVNQINDNEVNPKLTKKVYLVYSNLIKTFESFGLKR